MKEILNKLYSSKPNQLNYITPNEAEIGDIVIWSLANYRHVGVIETIDVTHFEVSLTFTSRNDEPFYSARGKIWMPKKTDTLKIVRLEKDV